jgi:sensor histidine kinase regulating citrate/malate metabolism
MENAAVINMKCHDLKKQIAMIRKMSDAEQREGSLKQVEKAILIYDGIAKTKNDTVNLIVSEKSMLCEKYGISFSYILKVDHLDKLNELDLYSLLGNALDNAIEEEVKIGEREKRIISLKTEMKDGNIQIHVENYIESRPIFKDGLPVTTKENKQWHGYGMKSIKYIAEKYHGTIDISVEDNMFNLDISIPAA